MIDDAGKIENPFAGSIDSANLDAANLSGMNPDEAKEYIFGFISTLKITEKMIQDIDEEIIKWKARIELAKSKNQHELALEAEKELERFAEKKQYLITEASELKLQIEKITGQLPLLAARQRSIDPDLLEQEILMAAGYMPGDEEKIRNERKFREMEKDASADEALAKLKAKMGKDT